MADDVKGSVIGIERRVNDNLTEREWDFLNTALTRSTMKDAAKAMGVSRARAYDILKNIKKKWKLAENTHNHLLTYHKKARRQGHWIARSLYLLEPQEPKELESVVEE